MKESFRTFAQRVSELTGSPWAFVIALVGVLLWVAIGPALGYSDTWLLAMSTVCSMIPALMVFLIQNTQNRDAKAMQLKLDELIRATSAARNTMIHLESLSDKELDLLEQEFERVRATRQRFGVAELQSADTTRSTSSP